MIDVKKFVEQVLTWEGVSFHHQGRNRYGVDCVGVTIAALQEQGVEVEDLVGYSPSAAGSILIPSIEASNLFRRKTHNEDLDEGDVLVFTVGNQPCHTAVYLGDGFMLHATHEAGVRRVSYTERWKSRVSAVYTWV